FERVLARRVMMHPSAIRQGRKRRQYHIALSGMQVAARWVAAQRPARTLELLPGGEPKREFEEQAKALSGQRPRRSLSRMEQRVIRRRAVVGNQWQLDHTGAREAAKRIRLVSPVHVTWPWGVTLGHVLGVPVVVAHPCHGVGNARD